METLQPPVIPPEAVRQIAHSLLHFHEIVIDLAEQTPSLHPDRLTRMRVIRDELLLQRDLMFQEDEANRFAPVEPEQNPQFLNMTTNLRQERAPSIARPML